MPAPPLAALEDVLQVLIPVVVFLLYVIGQVVSGKKAAGQQRPAPPARGKQQRPRPPVQQAGGRENQKDIANEIEEFLKRAGKQQPGRQQEAAEAKPRPNRRERQKQEKARRGNELRSETIDESRRRTLEQRVPESEAVVPRLASSLAPLPSESVRTSHSGEALEAHVHQAFDHQVGSLESSPGVPILVAAAGPEGAAAVAAGVNPFAVLLANRDSLKQAVVLKEILDRPEHRW